MSNRARKGLHCGRTLASLLITAVLVTGATAQHLSPADVSGMAWIAADSFLVAHDAKVPEEIDRPRLSIVQLPQSDSGPAWRLLDVSWPAGLDPTHDLESIAPVPGTNTYLILESGDDGTEFQRMFVGELTSDSMHVRPFASWRREQFNVEAAEIARIDSSLLFVFAERAHGEAGTWLTWAPLNVDAPAIGASERVFLPTIEPAGPDARPIAALTIDSSGRLYAASTMDPDADSGPFRSVVWRIGELTQAHSGAFRISLSDPPERLATIDGYKVESLAVREIVRGRVEVFIGTDDEHYGGTIRPLPLPPASHDERNEAPGR